MGLRFQIAMRRLPPQLGQWLTRIKVPEMQAIAKQQSSLVGVDSFAEFI
jgi:hypothetical protein